MDEEQPHRRSSPTEPDREERSALLHFLTANRAAAVSVVSGLTEDQARRAVLPSGWSVLDMLVHLAGVERHWFLLAVSGDRTDTPAWSEPVEDLAGAVAAYRAEWRRSDALLAGAHLDDAVAVQPGQLRGEVSTVRGVLLHVVEETARHAGHLDVVRELLDGRTGLGPR
ncbi:DinB family protein [Streptomyces sp. NP160]|uniref:DinB family protein n=1 Tax=Streptomyces sp. NP160 TaxID=2586637 RepID=UPI0015D6478C|nr:DinB family protein [Streptomyces sp. NP160]